MSDSIHGYTRDDLYPGGPSCRDLGTHHDPETGECLMPGCACTQFTPWTPPVHAEEPHHA